MPGETTLTAPVTVVIEGVRVLSELNQRGHWAAKHRRNRMQQDIVIGTLRARLDVPAIRSAGRLRVTFGRIRGPRGKVMDDDNLAGAFKGCRDAVAHVVGKDDGDPWYDWRYDPVQVRGRDYGVRITLTPLPAAGEG